MRDEFDAKWIALRTRFVGRLSERMADIELLGTDCASVDPRDALKTLFHIVHSLAGSAATFGFEELASVAREAETSIESAMMNAPPLASATAAHMADTLRQLTGVAATVVAASSRGGRP